MTKMMIVTVFAIGSLGASATAFGQVLAPADQRCTGYMNVTPTMAAARLNWAMYCHNHPMYPRTADAYLRQDSYNYHPSYQDPNGVNHYTYPVYYNMMSAVSGPWDAPNGGTDCSVMPTAAFNVGLCWSGCYTPETKIGFSTGPVGIKMAYDSKRIDLVTVASDAHLDDLRFEDNWVQNYTVDIQDAKQTIYNIGMASGGKLRVTDEHPLLLADGVMRQAKKLSVKDSLVKSDGTPDAIVSIEPESYFGKVYNLKPVTHDYSSNIIVAQGYLSGSARYQNEYLDMINSVILRRGLPDMFVDSVN